jgi:MYXO-CTERM domain-containing protein
VRANSSRVLDPATGAPTDLLFFNDANLRGNNTNNRKGGRYLRINLGVAQATKDGLKWIVPRTDVTDMMLGIDATHLVEASGLIEDNGKVVPALVFHAGSQNGGIGNHDMKVLGFDAATAKFVDYGTRQVPGSFDRHLYSNYLGQNPGNQGRNYADAHMIVSPFTTGAKYLMLGAFTGKAAEDVAKPEIKTSAFLSVVALQNATATPPPPAGMPNTTQIGTTGTGGGQNAAPQAGDPTPANEVPATPASAGTPGNFSSGCSMASGNTNANGIFFLLAGLALVGLVRRRRA